MSKVHVNLFQESLTKQDTPKDSCIHKLHYIIIIIVQTQIWGGSVNFYAKSTASKQTTELSRP